MVEIVKEKYDDSVVCCESDADDAHYPYGTSIELSDEMVEALGLGEMKAGDQVGVIAKAFIKSKSEHSSERVGEEDDKSSNVCIQFTDIEVAKEMSDAAESLYGD